MESDCRKDGYYTVIVKDGLQLSFFTMASVKGELYMLPKKEKVLPSIIKEVLIDTYVPFSKIPEL